MVFPSSPKRKPQELTLMAKAETIQKVLSEPVVDLWKLRELALSEGGLVNDELRRRAWPKLLGLVTVLETSHPTSASKKYSANELRQLAEDQSVNSYPTTHDDHSSNHEDHSVYSQNTEDASEHSQTPQNRQGEDDNDSVAAVAGDAGAEEQSENKPQNNNFETPQRRPKGPPALGAYLKKDKQKSQAIDLARDDISISSGTTATTTGPRGRRYALPILATSLDFRQIEMDVARCTWHLLTGDQRIQRIQMEHKRNRKVARLIRRKQRRLANLINYTLVQSYPLTSPEKLRYYQGYHDVACIFMSVLGGGTAQKDNRTNIPDGMHELASAMGLDLPARLLVHVSQSHLRDFLKPDFKELQTTIELTVFPLLAKLDPSVHDFLKYAEMQPFFALSWILTWFSHEVRDTDLVKRLFDAFLVSHPLLPIYLSVAMVLHPTNRQTVLSVDCDFGTVHQTLRNLTKNSSMVGWKYRPGDGYVSDDGEDEDDDEEDVALEQAGIDGDMEKVRSELGEKQDLNGTNTSVSTCVDSIAENQARVPFQELIDLAIVIMRRVPPRKLLPLAVRYYGGPHVAALLARSPSIRLFSDPAPWAVKSNATADWILHKRAKELGLSSEEEVTDDAVDQVPLKDVLKRKRKEASVIALGFGEGDERARRRRRRRRIAIAIGVAIVAVAVGMVIRRYSSQAGNVEPPRADATTAAPTRRNPPKEKPQAAIRVIPPRTAAKTSFPQTCEKKVDFLDYSREAAMATFASTKEEPPKVEDFVHQVALFRKKFSSIKNAGKQIVLAARNNWERHEPLQKLKNQVRKVVHSVDNFLEEVDQGKDYSKNIMLAGL